MAETDTVVFTINDIDLKIAPESISVQQEDLVYNWKTLRTKSSTKIPSGHGQSMVQVRIPFTDSDILALHRLVVEFRHSPFCFIENLYLRQTLCPEWPLGQKMAFTMTGLDIVPYPGTTNAWIVNLEMTWFNYFPYVHNWLYRRDWTTDWIASKNKKGEPYNIKLTIGWDIDGDGNRSGPRTNVIDSKSALTGGEVVHQEWSALNDSYMDKSLTIEDLELLHRGEIFDLLPMPSQMEKAFFVPQPGESLIYKRYINFLQRDALKKNFNIDLEKVIGYTPEDPGLFGRLLFGKFIVTDEEQVTDYVQPLHEVILPMGLDYPQLQAEWSSIVSQVMQGMLEYKQGVEFAFATYKSVQLPNKVARATQKILKDAQKAVVPQDIQSKQDDNEPWVYSTDRQVKARVRRGLSEPKGFHSPLGWEDEDVRTFDTLYKGKHDFLRWRSGKELNAIYSQSKVERQGRFHEGMDIGDGVLNGETVVFAVKDGTVTRVVDGINDAHSGAQGRWKVAEKVDGTWKISSLTNNADVLGDWEKVTLDLFDTKAAREAADVGTLVASEVPDRFYYVDFSDGGKNIQISHNDGREVSVYLHLAKITVTQGSSVKAGDVIGYVGNTSVIDPDQLTTSFEFNGDASPTELDYIVSTHLHFEYYERLDWHSERNANETDTATIVTPRSYKQYVYVDPRPTWQWAASQGYSDYISDNPVDESLSLEVAKEAVNNDPGLQDDDKTQLIAALDFMYQQGYFYYDRQEDITNVWWRPWRVSVQSVNSEHPGYDEIIRTDTAVLTNLTGGLRHVVANIPILGHEFPTQQHLGSIEPYYNMEFHLLDDSGTLEGIGERGGVLTALRFLLQHNSRKFRLIPDSWCLLTDCFMTRLLGTFQVSDLKYAVSSSDDEIITDFIINRRTMIARAQHDTVEGNPGLSRLLWEIQETNPYTQEALELNAPTKITVEEARKKVLDALFSLKFIDEYKDLALKLLIAQAAGANTSMPQDPNFGKFTLTDLRTGLDLDRAGFGQISSLPPTLLDSNWGDFSSEAQPFGSIRGAWSDAQRESFLHTGEMSDRVFLLQDDNQALYRSLSAAGIPVTTFQGVTVGNTSGKQDFLVIPESTVGLSKFSSKNADGTTVYDLSSLLKISQESLLLGEVPIGKIQSLALILRNIVISAEMYMSEDGTQLTEGEIDGTPLSKSKIQKELYDLPLEPRLLRTFQNYLTNTAAFFYFPNLINAGIGISPDTISASPAQAQSNMEQVTLILENNDNWLTWNQSAQLTEPQLRGEISWWTVIQTTFDVLTLGIGPAIADSLSRAWFGIKQGGRVFTALTSGSLPELQSYWAQTYQEETLDIASSIAKGYVRSMPLITLSASETVKDIIEDSVFGDLVGGLTGDSGLPAIANTQTRLTKAVLSSGYFGPHPWLSSVPFFLEPFGDTDKLVTDTQSVLDSEGNPVAGLTDEERKLGYRVKPIPYWQAALDSAPYSLGTFVTNIFLTNEEWFEAARVQLPGSPFIWNIDEGIETEKLRYFKQLLARLADACLQDPGVLKAFGLEGLAYLDRTEFAKGKEAYPDLDLPYHPYYGTTYAVAPDFYMWNMYDDGDVFNSAIRKEVSAGMAAILKNCYNSMIKLQGDSETGDNAYKPSRDKAIQDPNIDDTVALNIKYNAEGKDGMATPFYPTDSSKGAIEDFFAGLSKKVDTSKQTASDIATSDSETGTDSETGKDNTDITSFDKSTIQQLSSTKPLGVRLENGAGYYGIGTGTQYPSRLSGDQYKDLKSKVDSITDMFGSRAGYLKKFGKKELPEETEKRLDGTPLQRDLQPSHQFDLEALKQLAENSSNDLFSQKRRMARAYPTFKLYFIEEDEWETRLLNFDDFYSYNAVKDFTVTISRKTPGDVAVVTLQNVAGVLDGTKRDAVVDLDYFSTRMGSKAIGDNPVTAGTVEDQPFGALVLRPGLNVQLRAGYSNDPDNLNVLINGRVVDVQWNQQGDTAQIMIQSFGTELVQILKGTEPDSGDIHYTTHQLLGSLLLEPELQHFGRWEIGQLFQLGESQDYRFDFFDYSKEAHFGRFEYSSAAVKWFFRHPIVLYGLAIGGLAVASKLPGVGRLFSRVSRWGVRFSFVEKILTKFGIFGRIGEEAFEKELISAAARREVAGTVITSASQVEGSVAREVFEKYAATWATRAGAIGSRYAGSVFGADLEAAIRLRGESIVKGLLAKRAAGSLTIKEAAEAVTALEAETATMLLKGQWMTNPLGTATGFEMLKDIGRKPFANLLTGSFSGVSKVIGGAAAAGLVIDAAVMTGIPEDIYEATIGRAQKYFAATKVSLMLSPQDDNLFPPHPKDYMLLNQTLWADFKHWVTFTSASAITGSEALGNLVGHYFADDDPFDKKAPVASYQYKVTNSYIWDVLYEMSLRHPGWIYAIRPYGKQFRYTVFFGVPSQRYWSVPADNGFIYRANKVARMLEDNVTVDEYRSLYGDTIEGIDLQAFDTRLMAEAEQETPSAAMFKGKFKTIETWRGEEIERRSNGDIVTKSGELVYRPGVLESDGSSFGPESYRPNQIKKTEVQVGGAEEARNDAFTDKLEALRVASYTGRALNEYLRALNLRFVPFRRYHSISSEVDLVWNGIIGSENATYNAVDVTYFSEDPDDETAGPEGSALVKAHAFIPESKLRVKPLPPFINCRGYNMAMRYGMGELLFSLRDMYRGEIITLGNPRIMPWDIIILQDTYNSMVGPVEVEQVVHNFSHETGFITEIKPSAVVLANETSSWPLLEAMKLASLAVRNVENDALGMTADSFGSALTVVDWITDHGPGGTNPEYQDYAKRKMKEIFGENWDAKNEKFVPGKDLSQVIFGESKPGAVGVKEVNDAVSKVEDAASGVVDTLAVIGGLASIGLGLVAFRYKLPFGTQVAAPTSALAKAGLALDATVAGGGLLTSGLVLAADAIIDPPQLMSLLGGSLLMLQCLRGDSVMVIPLMKNGYPIAAGLNYHDPTMIWKNFMGDLGRFADDVLGGTRDLADLWTIYGMYAWRKLPEWDKIKTDEAKVLTGVDTTGGI